MNPNDAIRDKILKWFYDRNRNATSQRGKKGSSVRISDTKKELKALYGLSQQEVVSNLNYLIDKGWIKAYEVEKTVATRGGTTVPSVVTWYEISSAGIDRIEGASEFEMPAKYAGINISASESIVILGDGNVVNAKFKKLHEQLDELKSAIVLESTIPDGDKLNTIADIESIKEQLVKAEPDKTIIGHLWSRIEQVATAAGFVDAVGSLAATIAPLLTL